jgi:hypothetical protein
MAVAISALLATCIAIALYALYAYSMCGRIIGPEHIESYLPYADQVSFYIMIANGQYIAYILLHIVLHGMAAGMWALGGLMLSTVWQNIYVALFSPAIIVFFKDYVWAALSFYVRQRKGNDLRGFSGREPVRAACRCHSGHSRFL